MYMPNDVVWAKLRGQPWWPAQVISHEEYLLDHVTAIKRLKSGIEPIFVRLFKLQKYSTVTNKHWIQPFNSIHNEKYIKSRQSVIKNPNNEAVTARLLFDAALCEAQTTVKSMKTNDAPNGLLVPVYPTNGKLKTNMENENRTLRSSVDNNLDFSSDSDNDELPLVNISQETTAAFPYAQDDVVWAKYRSYTHWPALVTKVYPKERKLGIIFIVPDSVKSRLKISAKNIEPFHLDRNQDFYSQGLASQLAEIFKESYQRAEDYLRKRGLGSIKSSLEFFKSTQESVKEHVSTNDHSSLNSNKSHTKISRKSNLREDVIPVEEKKISVLEQKEILRRKKENKKLLNIITRKSITAHLLRILQGKWSCERHNKFKSPKAHVRRQLRQEFCFGPIVDEDQQGQLIQHIDEIVNDCGLLPKLFDRTSYMFEVLIPEAIIKGISILERCSQKDAENIFHCSLPKTTK